MQLYGLVNFSSRKLSLKNYYSKDENSDLNSIIESQVSNIINNSQYKDVVQEEDLKNKNKMAKSVSIDKIISASSSVENVQYDS